MNMRHRLIAPIALNKSLLFGFKRLLLGFLLFMLAAAGCFLIGSSSAQAQNWQALPPYNTLWPLWSPALSPPDPVTNVPTPIVSNLAKTTVLPAQPGLTWDPAWPNPWLLYNTPSGLLFYDPLYGINLWPPSYLLDPVSGVPVPITLPAGYPALPPTSTTWIQTTVPIANSTYLVAYPSYAPGTPFPLPSALLISLGVTTVPTVPALAPAASSLLGPVAILGTAVI
ncbi:MAG: hypothetical protein K6U11_13715 [bacterium]|nr:hypothetical protein [bacterium]